MITSRTRDHQLLPPAEPILCDLWVTWVRLGEAAVLHSPYTPCTCSGRTVTARNHLRGNCTLLYLPAWICLTSERTDQAERRVKYNTNNVYSTIHVRTCQLISKDSPDLGTHKPSREKEKRKENLIQ
ncbi:hypothetical protein E2C01_062815 [Portunus trituberculatus]|uniref:Uncharacterized protein n=1 Tax=Portunus trituberculatus TaxID=210409 RepID=A0A5B7HES8_PORTR|nr:hypothetical protein [Portunus trituberculatus]